MKVTLLMDDLVNDIYTLQYSDNLELRIIRISETVKYNGNSVDLDYFNIEILDISDSDNVISYQCPCVIGLSNDYMSLLPLSDSDLNGHRLTSDNYEDCYINLVVESE